MTQSVRNPVLRPGFLPAVGTALLAGVLSSLVNLVIWLVLRGSFDSVRVGPPDRQMPFSPAAIVLFSLAGSLGAGVVYSVIARLGRHPNRVFRWVAVLVLLLSFLTPLTIRNPPVSVVVGLELMHVVVFAFVLWLVPRR